MDDPPPVAAKMEKDAPWAPHKLAAGFASRASAPPESHADRFIYGLVQPLFGARVLFGDLDLLRAGMVPAGLLALFCAAVAIATPGDGLLRRFYEIFALLAPWPSVLLARHYARLAALAHNKLGFATARPCIEPLGRAMRRALAQMALVAFGLLPLTIPFSFVPLVGGVAIRVVVALWALHWIVVDAFDSARVLAEGQTLADLDRFAEAAPSPWFVRVLAGARDWRVVGRPLARFGRVCDRLARPFREEIALVESHFSLVLGFALATALLLATPILNLLFRPIVLVGASHVLGRVERDERDDGDDRH